MNLGAIKRAVDERTLDMEVIVNPKSLEGTHQGINVIQLETAVGAAMKVRAHTCIHRHIHKHILLLLLLKLLILLSRLMVSFIIFQCFENCRGVNVPRSRFLPVKTCQDLLLIMSNLYTLKKGILIMSPDRMFQTTPLIKLGDNHFKKVMCNTIEQQL